MTETVRKVLSESKAARWIALALISITMFFAYFFVDVVAPLQSMLETNYKWSPEVFGMLGGSEFFLNVFAFFLIFSGIILDKMGIRFTFITAGLTMVAGASLKFFALTDTFAVSGFAEWLNSFMTDIPASAKLAFLGFSIFGVGVEMAGITVSKTIVKWFKGKEMALAMGLEMATARLGVFAVFRLTPIFAENGGVSNSVFMGVSFLIIGFLFFLVYTFMDARLDKETGFKENRTAEDEFKFSDIKKIFMNPGFLAIAGLCVLFYSAIFPFQKFATDMLASKLNIPIKDAAAWFSYFPIGAMILTPFIGLFLDLRGKGASMMLYGAILLTISHLIFAFVPEDVFNVTIALCTIVILGTAFSLVPASMWPSVPKIVEDRYLGSAYGAIFWIQNIGLLAVPILIGWALTTTNPGVGDKISKISEIKDNLKENQVILSDYMRENKNEYSVNYFKEDSSIISKYIDQLEQKYPYESDRTIALDSIELTTDKILAISNDTTVISENKDEISVVSNEIKKNVSEMRTITGDVKYNYTIPEIIFACFGLLAIILSLILRVVDKRKGYGLEIPNKKKSA